MKVFFMKETHAKVKSVQPDVVGAYDPKVDPLLTGSGRSSRCSWWEGGADD